MRDPRASSGFTFIEMLVALVILGVVGGVSFQALQVTSRASTSTVFQSDLDQRLHRALERVARDLQEARTVTITPDPLEPLGTASLGYRCAEVSDDDSEIVWGAPRGLVLVPSDTDPQDGKDNDHDGLVDEMELRLVLDVGLDSERGVVLVRGVAPLLQGETANAEDDNDNGLVDEPGFCISRRGDVLTVRLTLLGRDPQGRIVTRTGETTVCPRN